jgi:hypothetical protein
LVIEPGDDDALLRPLARDAPRDFFSLSTVSSVQYTPRLAGLSGDLDRPSLSRFVTAMPFLTVDVGWPSSHADTFCAVSGVRDAEGRRRFIACSGGGVVADVDDEGDKRDGGIADLMEKRWKVHGGDGG